MGTGRRWSGWLVPPLIPVLAALTGCSTAPISRPNYQGYRGVAPPVQVARASWYGPGFNGRPTSTGEFFNENRLTAASRTLPLGTQVRVTNLANGRSVAVRINDRGPYVRGRGLDLSRRAAQEIGLTSEGVGRVEITGLDVPISRPHPSWTGQVRVHHRRWHGNYAMVRIVPDPVGSWLLGSFKSAMRAW
jgi:Lytic transglycolase